MSNNIDKFDSEVDIHILVKLLFQTMMYTIRQKIEHILITYLTYLMISSWIFSGNMIWIMMIQMILIHA